MWITSSRVLPIIMLVVIPISATILGIVLSEFFPLTPTFLYYPSTSTTLGFFYLFSFIYLISISGLFYAFYPIKQRIIERRGFANLLTEQTYIKNILYLEIPILIVSTFFMSVLGFYEITTNEYQTVDIFLRSIATFLGLEDYKIWILFQGENEPSIKTEWFGSFVGHYFFNGLMINLGISVTSGIIWLIIIAARRELGYHFAKSLFQTTTQEKEESKKAEYFIRATKIYDKYLRRTLNLEINNAKRIYSKILSDPNLNENKSILQISKSFDNKNKLAPINSLSEIAYVEGDKDTFLVDESLGMKIKDMAIFFATIIPVAITIIQLLLQGQ